jgi:adenine C2-methylase RlmN of 23S rRNA A2503 and tRNA A37
MKIKTILKSKQDLSVNFVFDNNFEARFVRREKDYFIIYLSSQDGCNKSCRFCHLTQTKQTSFNHATLENYLFQTQTVLNYYNSTENTLGAATKVHINFMARGEPLANPTLLNSTETLFNALEELIKKHDLSAQFNISTIMPKEIENINLTQTFQNVKQNYAIYYSLYSTNHDFRKQWLPKSLDYNKALTKLSDLQNKLQTKIVFHWAFIENHNDHTNDLEHLKKEISKHNIKAKFNLVRYNPYSNQQGQETNENKLHELFSNLNDFFNTKDSRIVPRVGFDVKASCGMFVLPNI